MIECSERTLMCVASAIRLQGLSKGCRSGFRSCLLIFSTLHRNVQCLLRNIKFAAEACLVQRKPAKMRYQWSWCLLAAFLVASAAAGDDIVIEKASRRVGKRYQLIRVQQQLLHLCPTPVCCCLRRSRSKILGQRSSTPSQQRAQAAAI